MSGFRLCQRRLEVKGRRGQGRAGDRTGEWLGYTNSLVLQEAISNSLVPAGWVIPEDLVEE